MVKCERVRERGRERECAKSRKKEELKQMQMPAGCVAGSARNITKFPWNEITYIGDIYNETNIWTLLVTTRLEIIYGQEASSRFWCVQQFLYRCKKIVRHCGRTFAQYEIYAWIAVIFTSISAAKMPNQKPLKWSTGCAIYIELSGRGGGTFSTQKCVLFSLKWILLCRFLH